LFDKGAMTAALRQGLREANAQVPEAGATNGVTYTRDGQREGRKNPPKISEIQYTPPTRKAKADSATEFLGTDDGEDEVRAPKKGRIAREVAAAKKNVRAKAAAAALADDEEPPF